MAKKAPYYVELGLGVLLTTFVAFSNRTRTTPLETVSLKTYDLLSKFRKTAPNTDAINIVEIDEESVSNLGRWPWPRAIVAQLVDEVVAQGAKVIGLNIFYTEPDQNQGLEEITRLRDDYEHLLNAHRGEFRRKKVGLDAFQEFGTQLSDSVSNLNGDDILLQSIEQANTIVLPMYFQPGDVLGNNLEPVPTFFGKEKMVFANADKSFPKTPAGMATVLPLDGFGEAALAIGHSNPFPDRDGSLRRIAPVIRYGDSYYPSFGIQLVREYLNLDRGTVDWSSGNGFVLGKARIPVDEDAKTFLAFAGPAGTFKRYSALNVLSGAVPEKVFENKIVLVGVTAPGLMPTFVAPSGESFSGMELWATHVENIMNQRFVVRPPWARKAEWAVIALAALVLLILPLLRARVAVPVAAVVFLAMLGSSSFLFIKQGLWFSPAYGVVLLILGFALIVAKRLVMTEKGKELVEAEGVETNKMLGLSFQGQGMLDLAFEKFRRCPVDQSMKEVLYNLGLDLERKRQFTKAAAVYEHISTVDVGYKDIKDKIELLKKAGEGAVFGGIGKKGGDATVVVEGLGQNTTLGRYEVMKELGRGAMGIVYLGKDPKINRSVAIKTLRFEDNADEEQTKSVKERFFREAESAGNLTHPNIIRIFDAGEDQEVAYIAMELLEGHDLKKYCDKANLLPMPRVLDLVAQVAEGLDYAHKQGVVHRDIKPGNIMLLKDGTLRITDFGIARIQATSKTATGAVLGTPAYMSPEQVNGKKVDGRADIFSLGVTLYEMLTGDKPFYADTIAALLYRIANVDHPDPREFRSEVYPDVVPILNKALAKDPAGRYQTATEMALDLRECIRQVSNKGSEPVKTEPAKPVSVTPAKKDVKADFISELGNAIKQQGEESPAATVSQEPPKAENAGLEKPGVKSSDDTLAVLPKDFQKTVAIEGKNPPSNTNGSK